MFAGALTLLSDSLAVCSKAEVDCTLMGGWNALLYKLPHRLHPGTFDVDLLLPPLISADDIERLATQFFSAGFSRSAKHEFQLLRSIEINGVPFTFNVDLLHPKMEATRPGLFHDLMSLDVQISAFDKEAAKMKSILIGGVDEVVWEHGSKRQLSLTEADTDFTFVTRFPDPAVFVLSKAFALDNAKRPRDSYDIFLTLESVGQGQVADDIYELATTSPAARSGLENLRENMQTKLFSSRFQENGFLQALDPGQKSELQRAADEVCREFLSRTDRYPKGMRSPGD